MTKTGKRIFSIIACLLMCTAFICPAIAEESVPGEETLNPYGVQTSDPYVVRRFWENGKQIDEIIVPGRPPAVYRAPAVTPPEPNIAMGTNTITNVPAFSWCFGCSATSAAMMFGHYDNSGYANMYAGPTNSGVMPMDNSSWPDWVDSNSDTRHQCPLSATHDGLDGRTTKGHVDDYWIAYDDAGPDPFIGNWTEHTQGDCTADYMGTNQSLFENTDGSTTFYNYTTGAPLYDYIGAEPDRRDGCHGMKLFVESRGYTVYNDGSNSQNYSQYIKGQGSNPDLGFTFEDFKAEIDAGRPVLIGVVGHTMLGYGYNDTGEIIYIHDTWDYLDHEMTWGGVYSTMQHRSVTVLRLDAAIELFTITLDTSPANTGSITFDSTLYVDGGTVGKVADTYDITAGPEPGYTFSAWQVSGGLTVADSTLADTTCAVTADGTLRMVQEVTPFSDSDFSGTWNLVAVRQNGDAVANGWAYGPITSDGVGGITAGTTLTRADTTTDTVAAGSTYTLNSNGTITMTLNMTSGAILNIEGAMNNRKDVISLVSTETGSPDVYEAGTLIKEGSEFSNSDFSDIWNLYVSWQNAGAVANGWFFGPVTSDGAGNITAGTLTFEDTTTKTVASGSYTLGADGMFTAFSLVVDGETYNIYGAAMNNSKDVVGLVFTNEDATPDIYGGGALVKNQASFSDSNFNKGTWRYYDVWQVENLASNGWCYGTYVSDGAGQITSGTYNNQAGGTGSIAPVSYDLDANGFLTIPPTNTSRWGAMNDGCDVIAYVLTDTGSPGEYGAGVMVYPTVAGPPGKKDDDDGWYDCAIATATYGTPMASEVKTLSTFRDESLLTNKIGQTLVSTYERISPPVADFIRDKESLKAVVRTGLKPLVWIADKITH